MKRWVLTILLFLLLGAIVNVAVAWAIASSVRVEYDISSERLVRLDGGPFWWTDHSDAYANQQVGEVQFRGWGRSGYFLGGPDYGVTFMRCGWPTRSMQHAVEWFGRPLSKAFRAIQLPSNLATDPSLKYVPLQPIWPGFAINTAFYAGVLWLLFAATFALRRWRRIKRGLCPKCAYPVGTSDVCTECGGVVRAARV